MSALATRRGVLGAMAVAPMVLAVPAQAAATNRHAVWLVQRQAAFDYANDSEISEEECAQRTDDLCKLENRILRTPARNKGEAVTKLRLACELQAEGNCLDMDDAAGLLEELDRWVS